MKQKPLQIRLADLNIQSDAENYSKLLNAYAQDPMGLNAPLAEQTLQRTVNDLQTFPTARIFLAELGSQPVGFATCFLGYSSFKSQTLLNIHDIASLKEFRGQGIGRRMLQAIAEQARREGCCKLTLEVRDDNPQADGLYRSEGFSHSNSGDRPIQYLFLEKSLD